MSDSVATWKRDMISPGNFLQRQKLCGLLVAPPAVLAIALAMPVHADYQQTLAARGADAFTSEPIRSAIEPEDIAAAFSSTDVLAAPALSDQEVMIDLHNRMNATDQLHHAAASLAPESSTEVVEQAPAEVEESAGDQTPVVASR